MKKVLLMIFAGIGVFFFALILLAVFVASRGHDSKQADLPDKMVLMLTLDNGIQENTTPQNLLTAIRQGQNQLSLQQIIQTLDQARLDQRVQGLAMDVQSGDFGLATVQELRTAVQRFRRSGKFAYFYADTLGDSPAMAEYWLASSFDKIWLQPLGQLAITGFAAEMPFVRTVLDKIGIEPELQHVGKYKSYPEMLMRSSASDDNRMMTNDMLDVLMRQFARDIVQARKVTAQDVQAVIKNAPLSAQEAQHRKLIDGIGYRDEFDALLEQTTKGGEPVDLVLYHQNGPRPVPGEKVALVTVVGTLTSYGEGGPMAPDAISAEEVTQAIQDAVDQKQIQAIIVRVDSPGGTPLAADSIRRAIELARTRKPVIVSMSNAAASGGYWMSVDANKIVAQPATMTGSIGVFGGKFNVATLWKKLGVNWENMPANGQQDLWSLNRPYSQVSRAKVQKMMQDTYDIFIAHVAKGRKMKPERVESLAQGRVWTGEQALENGLVDALGGVDVAVNLARDLAKIPASRSINLVPFPKERSFIEQVLQLVEQEGPLQFLSSWMQQSFSASLQHLLQTSVPIVRA